MPARSLVGHGAAVVSADSGAIPTGSERERVSGPGDWEDCRVAAVRLGALGDILAMTPALALLRSLRPGQTILAGRGAGIRILRDAGIVDVAWDLDGAWAAPLFRGVPAVPPTRGNPRGFPDRLVLLGRFDPALREACRAAGAIFDCTGSAPPGCRVATHHAAPWGEPDLSVPWLRSWALRRPAPSGADGAFIVHPGSGSPSKNWPAGRWAEVLAALRRERPAPVAIVIGPADAAVAGDLVRRLQGRVLRLENLAPARLAAALARARLFLGNDSGVAHLAGLVGAPTAVVFGPTDPAEWLPAGPHVVGLSGEKGSRRIEAVDPTALIDAARRLLALACPA